MNIFNKPIKVGGIPKNKFDLSHEKKLSLNLGKLVPILTQEVVPGDSFRVSSEIFLRMAPMIAPIMHRVDIYTHYFYVPNRVVWSGWDDFISKEGVGVPVKVPQFTFTANQVSGQTMLNGTLSDYLGLPTLEDSINIKADFAFSQLPFRAYQTIYNEYYRDQTLSTLVPVPTGDADINVITELATSTELMQLRTRSWEKDYFTSALPNPQYGSVGAIAPLQVDYLNITQVVNSSGAGSAGTAFTSTLNGSIGELNISPGVKGAVHNLDTQATGTTIEDLRRANTLQLWLERQARGGQRLVETVLSHFGVRVPDARVSRPEYLGGGKQHISISEVLSTYDNTAGDLPQGNMSGHGISSGQTHGFTHTFPEHGYVIGIMSVLPKSAYQQGVNKHWTRSDKFDFYWPTFANLGEQAISNLELFWDGNQNPAVQNGTFGYTPRYAEYKYQSDTVHGDFRENLAYWHMGRIFASTPALNEDFIRADNDEMDRVFAVTDPTVNKLWCQIYHNISALRPMPMFGTPRL